jgi:hypothetical protein
MTPIINGFSTNFGPAGQWVYINGFEFIDGKTSVLIDDQPVDSLTVFSDILLGFFVPKNLTNGLKSITIRVDTEETVVPDFFDVGTPTAAPKVELITIHGNNEWVYITGADFVWEQTTVTFNDKTIDCFVYNVSHCGFAKGETEIISSITITTPNGSITYDASV